MNRLASLLRLQNAGFCNGRSTSIRIPCILRNYAIADLKLGQLCKFSTTEDFGPIHKPRKFGRDPHHHPKFRPLPPPEFLKPGEKPDEFEIICYRLHFIRMNNLGYRLKLWALYMQATEGPLNEPEPDKDDHYEHAYWKAWKQLGNMSKEEARSEYIRIGKQRLETRDPDIIIND